MGSGKFPREEREGGLLGLDNYTVDLECEYGM
jgi:hypothetical protein